MIQKKLKLKKRSKQRKQKKAMPGTKNAGYPQAKIIFPIAALICAALIIVQTLVNSSGEVDLAAEFLSLQLPFVYSVGIIDIPQKTPYISTVELPPDFHIELVDFEKGVSDEILIELLHVDNLPPQSIDLSGSDPRILIYHTHTTEAYLPTDAHRYTETSAWRTNDNSANIVAIGDYLTELLREKYNINVIHDITNHEPPKLSTAYTRSLSTMEYYKKHYPSITMYIDVHRDAYGTSSTTEPTDFIIVNGKEVARMMFVVGTGEGATGTGFGDMPDFASNYALARRITERLLKVDSHLMRNIRVKTGRYNQHISSACLLVEIGHNANTFEQARGAIELLAAAIAAEAGDIDGIPIPASGGFSGTTPPVSWIP